MRRIVAIALFLSLVPMLALAEDLKITDSSGAQVVVKNARIDYSGALGAALREEDGIRVQQGEGTVTVKWKDIQSLRITGGDGASKPDRLDIEVRLRNGRQVTAFLQRPGDARLRGTTDLGEYSLDLHKVRSIEPLR